jgi:hypothetical protein
MAEKFNLMILGDVAVRPNLCKCVFLIRCCVFEVRAA